MIPNYPLACHPLFVVKEKSRTPATFITALDGPQPLAWVLAWGNSQKIVWDMFMLGMRVMFSGNAIALKVLFLVLKASRLQNETAPEKLLNRYEKRFEKREKGSEKRSETRLKKF